MLSADINATAKSIFFCTLIPFARQDSAVANSPVKGCMYRTTVPCWRSASQSPSSPSMPIKTAPAKISSFQKPAFNRPSL